MQPDIIFKDFRVTPTSVTSVVLEWSIHLNMEDQTQFRYRIWRSNSTNGPWNLLIDNLSLSTVSWADFNEDLHSKLRETYWTIEAYKLDESWSTKTNPLEVAHAYDKIAMALIQKEHLALRNPHKGTGVRCYLFILRNTGPRCPVCWDIVKQKPKISNCPTCYATGFALGYYNPVEMYLNFQPADTGAKQADISMLEISNVSAWTSPSPKVNVNDIIVDVTRNERYRVTGQRETIKRGACLRQIMQLSMLRKNNIEYNLRLPS